MSVQDFLLPDLGEGLTEGTIVEWLVNTGDQVTVDQPVAQVETEKAVVEVPCPFAGEVTALHAEPGQEVQVGERLLSIRTGTGDGTAPGGADAAAASPDPWPSAAAEGESPPDRSSPESRPADDTGGDGESGSVLVGYGTRARGPRRRRHAAAAGRPLAKPPVRKLAKDLGVDLREVEPSGPGGVITRDDVHAAAEERAAPAAAPAAAPTGPVDRQTPERIPVTGVRRRIAERMAVSRSEIPEATAWVDCDATELMRARDELNARQDAVRVSPLTLILRACVAGLRRHPELNSTFDADAGEIVRYRAVHLGVAAQTERGLLVPVIRDADLLTTLDLAAELQRLSAGAREGTLSPQELSGSTFTVSNYGLFGVDGGNPVINHPEAAILGVGQITDRPWVVEGALTVRKVCQLSIAFDHRACDGGEAGGFLRFVADCVESPAVLLGAV